MSFIPNAAAFAFTAVACVPVLKLLRGRAIVDVPNHRSSHTVATPRGAGLAVAIGALLAVATVRDHVPGLLVVAVGSAAFGVLGLIEDLRGVNIGGRLLAQTTLAIAATTAIGNTTDHRVRASAIAVLAVLALFVVSYVNAFNFMDGINAISGAQAVVTGVALAVLGHHFHVLSLEAGAGILAGAALGFLPFNAPRARMFLGDVGSYFLGAWIALLMVLAVLEHVPIVAAVSPAAIYGIDTASTVIRRLRNHEVVFEPHRSHVYQQLARRFGSHMAASAVVSTATAASAALGYVVSTTSGWAVAASGCALVAVVAGYGSLAQPGSVASGS